MQIHVFEDDRAMSRKGADLIIEALRRRPDLLMCVATGASPLGTYAELAARKREAPGLFAGLRVLKLDEWGGLDLNDPGTCETYIRRHVLAPLDVAENRYVSFDSNPADPADECRRLRDTLARLGPMDVCVLGLGANGHLALNEPADRLTPFAHVAHLAESSQQHAMLGDAARAPRYGLTLGMADLMGAKMVLLLVNGPHKREPLQQLMQQRIDTRFPASLLWLHPNVVCLCDRRAADGVEIP